MLQVSKGFLKAKNWRGGYPFAFDETPTCCPRCNEPIRIQDAVAARVEGPNFPDCDVKVIFQCANHSCMHVFLSPYTVKDGNFFEPASRQFGDVRGYNWERWIREISPRFFDILRQASANLRDSRDDTAGPGFRKAFETLVKDYDSLRDGSSHRRSAHLMSLIDNIDDEYLKEFARRVAWLGNDFTHTERRWPEYDLSDLERLVLSFAQALALSHAGLQLVASMPISGGS